MFQKTKKLPTEKNGLDFFNDHKQASSEAALEIETTKPTDVSAFLKEVDNEIKKEKRDKANAAINRMFRSLLSSEQTEQAETEGSSCGCFSNAKVVRR